MRATASLLLVAILAGCSLAPSRDAAPPAPAAESMSPMDNLLSLLQSFIAAAPEQRSAIYLDTVRALADAPSAPNRLRLALLQGWPGHPHSRPDDALRLVDAVVADDSLDGDLHDLARVLRFWIASHQVDQRRQRHLNERIADLESRITELQRQLQELTEIERAIEPAP
ncbi:MAG: hypothetical protein WD081_03105 [Gammaproteobacteria bacterium]